MRDDMLDALRYALEPILMRRKLPWWRRALNWIKSLFTR